MLEGGANPRVLAALAWAEGAILALRLVLDLDGRRVGAEQQVDGRVQLQHPRAGRFVVGVGVGMVDAGQSAVAVADRVAVGGQADAEERGCVGCCAGNRHLVALLNSFACGV